MPIKTTWVAWMAIPGLLLATVAVRADGGQANTNLTCTTLLTADELTAAVGARMTASDPPPPGEVGETECQWTLRVGAGMLITVALRFYDLRYVKAHALAPTLESLFALEADAAEGETQGKRQALSGIGDKAIIVSYGAYMVSVVQRTDGIAKITANNLTREQVAAVARAVAAPAGR
jgi:hypothetical protein